MVSCLPGIRNSTGSSIVRCFFSTNSLFLQSGFIDSHLQPFPSLLTGSCQFWHAARSIVRRKTKQTKKGDQTMNTEIITLEVEEMEEVAAPGLILAD